MRAALVIGAASHVGNALVRELVARGVPTRAVVYPGEPMAALDGLPIDVAELDAGDFASLVPAMVGAEVVFQADLSADANVARATVAATKHANVRRLVYLAPMESMGRPRGEWLDELVGLSSEACRLVEDAAVHGEVDAVVVTLSNPVGPWDFDLSNVGALISAVGRRAQAMVVNGLREWVDVRDAATAIVAAAERGRCAETYLLSNGALEVQRVCELVAADARVPMPVVLPRLLSWPAGKLHPSSCAPGAALRASTLKACQELGFAPRAVERSVVESWVWLMTHALSPMRRQLKLSYGRRPLHATT